VVKDFGNHVFPARSYGWGEGGLGRAVVALHSLHVSSEESRRCCQGDTA
jgi:hypothetical protein